MSQRIFFVCTFPYCTCACSCFQEGVQFLWVASQRLVEACAHQIDPVLSNVETNNMYICCRTSLLLGNVLSFFFFSTCSRSQWKSRKTGYFDGLVCLYIVYCILNIVYCILLVYLWCEKKVQRIGLTQIWAATLQRAFTLLPFTPSVLHTFSLI